MNIQKHFKRLGLELTACQRAACFDREEKRLFDLAVRQGNPVLLERAREARAKAQGIRKAARLNQYAT